MSRIGNKPIFIPNNIDLKFFKNILTVKGNLGTLSQKISDKIKINISKNILYVIRNNEDKKSKSLQGLYRVLINNMIIGVSLGFKKELELIGIGYKAVFDINNKILNLNLGYSHDIMIKIPNEINIEIRLEKSKNYIITLKSYDKQLLGIFSYKIRSLRPPEPYKGKGVRFLNEIIRKKVGKSA
ncbi:50S ribosomal protein L6 [Blattabacterium cuenoti]|uniref:50S ribosomal protein L6 n=1 Tax=Blattabacterium cuenoti TaxID=1653831 RepID=UPI00163B9056|nr:50S ribosomal protein L6 [Blattabacterium cuenoti]